MYDEARPGYPSSVIEDIIRISEIVDGGRVLDIGCGSGRATILFGKRGYQIIGVDLSKELVAIARQKSSEHQKVSYYVGEFEHVDLPSGKFDLITAGQALHWIEPEVGYNRIFNLLKESGTLAAFWNFENYEARSLAVQVRDLYREHCTFFPPDLGSPQRYLEKLDASGLFEPIKINTHYWNWELTKEKYIKLVRSYAWVSSLPNENSKHFLDDLARLLEDKPENITVPFKTILLTTKKSHSTTDLAQICMDVGVNHPQARFMDRVPDEELDNDFSGYELNLARLRIAVIHVSIDCSYVRVYQQEKKVYSAFLQRNVDDKNENGVENGLQQYYISGDWEKRVRELEKNLS